jgi:hypothetical protein
MVMKDVNNELSEQLLAVLHDRVKGMKLPNSSYFGNLANANLGQAQAAATAMQSAVSMGLPLSRSPAKPQPGADDEDEQQSVTAPSVTLNNLETSAEYASQLHQEFERDAAEVFQLQIGSEGAAFSASSSDPGLDRKLRAAVADMAKLSTKANSLLESGMGKLSSLLKPRLLSLTDKLVGEQSAVIFELSEEDFAENEANDPFAHELLRQFDALLEEYQDELSDANFGQLLEVVTESLTQLLEERFMNQTFNQLGGIQLDKDVRILVKEFTRKSEASNLRDHFVRLTQIALLVNLDRPSDVLDYWGTGNGDMAWRLSKDEIKEVLSLRSDFSEDEVMMLVLQ